MAEGECARCGAPFLKYRDNSKFCSKRCSQNARQAAYTARQPAGVRAQWRRYFYTDRGTVTALLGNARDRARSSGVPFALTREFVQAKLTAGVCELSGLPLERKPRSEGGGSRTHPFAPSLARVVPALGYVEHNVRMTCFAVNQARSDYGDEVLMTVASAIVKNMGILKQKQLTA